MANNNYGAPPFRYLNLSFEGNIINMVPMIYRNMGFMVVPPGQFAYQNAYWIEPDALQAQENVPNHVAEAQAHHEHHRVIMRDARAREALNADRQRPQQANIPPGCRPYRETESVHSLGPMELECRDCHAMHFLSEKLTKSSRKNPKVGV